MEKLLFVRAVLTHLAEAKFFCRAAAWVIRISAALMVLYSLVTFFSVGKLIFTLPTTGILGGVLFEVFFVVAVYAAVHVLVLRAKEIEALPAHPYYALPLGAKLVQMLGETYAAFVTFVAVGGGLFVWFTNQSLSKVLNPLIRALFPGGRDDPSFMGGIAFVVTGILTALAVLILAYVIGQLLQIASNATNKVVTGPRAMAEQGEGFRSRFG
ncbi:MAG: hypothetical protein JSW09_03730 [Pseudomonadota bacterium]|nr:MAG: hypothetical protein JSW09_03730 [Pseudomonadota bacterium]